MKYWNSRQRAKSKCYLSVQNLCSFFRPQIIQIVWTLDRFEVIDGKLCMCLQIYINDSKIWTLFQNWSVENIHLKTYINSLNLIGESLKWGPLCSAPRYCRTERSWVESFMGNDTSYFPPRDSKQRVLFFHRQILTAQMTPECQPGVLRTLEQLYRVGADIRLGQHPVWRCLSGCLGKGMRTEAHNDASNIWWFVAQRFLSLKKVSWK